MNTIIPVLILVVMEDGLVHTIIPGSQIGALVLILVVMEDGLVHGTVNHSAMSASQS